MRVWTVTPLPFKHLDGSIGYEYMVTADDRQRIYATCGTEEDAHLIADALNEKEQREAEEQPLTAEERAALTAQGYAELGEGVEMQQS